MLKETAMGLFDDILKGLPVNPLLREKIAELEAKYAATETENAILKDDLREAKAENQKLKKQVEELSHKNLNEIDEIELKLLQLLSQLGDRSYTAIICQEMSPLPAERVKYHLKNLEDAGYAGGGIIHRTAGLLHRLTQSGRKLLIDKGAL